MTAMSAITRDHGDLEPMPDWDPNLYLKFSNHRARPAEDLVAQIALEDPRRVIDLGCGTGNSTEKLHRRWPRAELTGLDNSVEMLAQARSHHPDWKWIDSTVEACAVLDWVRSTAMRPYLDGLPNDEQRRLFAERCLERLEKAYPADDQGKTLFPYRRMFIIAYR
jgi:trans-aconitate methyltransferase